jgi:hypothetical protein
VSTSINQCPKISLVLYCRSTFPRRPTSLSRIHLAINFENDLCLDEQIIVNDKERSNTRNTSRIGVVKRRIASITDVEKTAKKNNNKYGFDRTTRTRDRKRLPDLLRKLHNKEYV